MDLLDYSKNPGVPMPDGTIKRVDVAEPESEFANQAPKQTYFRSNGQFGIDKEIKEKTQFYFRLSGRNLYYTETKTDMRVLGAISVRNIKKNWYIIIRKRLFHSN